MERLIQIFTLSPLVRAEHEGKISEHWPELPQLARRSVDRCDIFPVVLGVEAIYLNRRCSMKPMLFAAIGTAHSIVGRSYRPGLSKQQSCSARAIHHSLLWVKQTEGGRKLVPLRQGLGADDWQPS
jgi:hypothetical protein